RGQACAVDWDVGFSLGSEGTLVPRAASLPLFTRLPASESLSLAWPRESNQREGHPDAAVSGLLPSDFAKRFRGWLTVHPCTDNQLARIPASHPAGNSSTTSPPHRGPIHCTSCAAKPKQSGS